VLREQRYIGPISGARRRGTWHHGTARAGLTALAEALTLVDATGGRWYEAKLYRLKGALLLQQNADNQAEAEPCFHHALDLARNHQAKSFEYAPPPASLDSGSSKGASRSAAGVGSGV